MKCSRAEEMLPLLAGGELDSFRRRGLEKHLSQCAKCRRVLSQYKNLLELSRGAPPVQVPDPLKKACVREIMDRSHAVQRREDAFRHGDSSKKIFPFRYGLAGTAAVIAVASLAVIVALGIHFFRDAREPGVEDYLRRSDLRGLSWSLKNDDSRRRLLDEPVSVDLLIQALENLQRPRALHGHVEQYIARSLLEIKNDLQAELAGQTTGGSQPVFLLTSCADINGDGIRYEKILRALRCLHKSGARITVRELLRSVATAKNTKEEIG